MWELLTSPVASAVLSVAGLLVVLFVAYRVIEALRPSTSKDDMSDHDLVSDFEEMRLGGDINEEELRSIRAVLAKTQEHRHTDPK
ncbi:MAG: hypothetical protein R3C53_09020 [Pirellulaceae bacterium]